LKYKISHCSDGIYYHISQDHIPMNTGKTVPR